MKRYWLLVLLTLAASGCALLGKGKPLALRYFDLGASDDYKPAQKASALRLRLGTVSASRYIDRRFVSRRSARELTYYDEWRFTDPPDAFLDRTLERNLFERAGVTRVLSGLAPTLEVELVACEELKLSGRHKAHVSALALLHDDRVQLWQHTFEVESEIGTGDAAEALAEALSKALTQVAIQITEETLRTLAQPPAP
jgi:uncharacterized lipoprotein YmbA